MMNQRSSGGRERERKCHSEMHTEQSKQGMMIDFDMILFVFVHSNDHIDYDSGNILVGSFNMKETWVSERRERGRSHLRLVRLWVVDNGDRGYYHHDRVNWRSKPKCKKIWVLLVILALVVAQQILKRNLLACLCTAESTELEGKGKAAHLKTAAWNTQHQDHPASCFLLTKL